MPDTTEQTQIVTPPELGQDDLLISLELSYKSWLVTSLSPGSQKMSKRTINGGDIDALLELIQFLKAKSLAKSGKPANIVVIQEIGLDGFWIHRALEKAGVESWLVDPASVAVSRRYRRVKTDKVDGEALIRVLAAFKRGEPRVCSMAVPPSHVDEDRRRLGRERDTLVTRRVQEVNRIKGLLLSHGIRDYCPMAKNQRDRLESLRAGDGKRLPPNLRGGIRRSLDRLELLLSQIEAIEAAREKMAKEADSHAPRQSPQTTQVHWANASQHATDGRSLPPIRQPTTTCCLCRSCANTLPQR